MIPAARAWRSPPCRSRLPFIPRLPYCVVRVKHPKCRPSCRAYSWRDRKKARNGGLINPVHPAPMASAMRRIDQLIASLGYGTPREAREWLREARGRGPGGGRGEAGVGARGVPATAPGPRVEPADVRIDGEPLDHPGRLLILLNKPAGRGCSHDPSEAPSVYGLLPARWQRRNPAVTSVGRLDKETTGLLLLTDCSAIVHRLTSPRHKVPKVYRAILDCGLPPGAEAVFASGRCLLAGDDKPCEPATLRRIGEREVEIAVTEGRYHQVRRMFASLGCAVLSLPRTRFGDLDMGNLAPGQWIEFPVNHFDPA